MTQILVSSPHKLNPETPLTQNIVLLNENFRSTLDYASALQPQTQQYNKTFASFPISAGTTTNLLYGVYSPVKGNNIVATVPSVSIYVDANDPTLLFPDGTALTAGQKSLRYSLINMTTTATFDPNTTYTDFSGNVYYIVGLAVIQLNNADASNHTYYVLTNFQPFARPSTLFR